MLKNPFYLDDAKTRSNTGSRPDKPIKVFICGKMLFSNLVDLIYALLLISELKDTVSGQLKIFTPVSGQLKVLTSTPDNKKF